MSELHNFRAREIAARVQSGEIKATEVAAAFLARAKATNPVVGAYLDILEETAMEQAQSVDSARAEGATLGALCGVPMGLKDIFVTQGLPTRCGSKMLEGWTPGYNGTVAARLVC